MGLPPPDWAPYLRKISLFSQFGEETFQRLHSFFRAETAPAGKVIFREGDPGDSLYLLLSGQIRLTHHANGKERMTSLLGRRGDTIGEMSLLSGNARQVTAQVERDAEYLVLNRSDFENILRESPELALPLARQLSSQLSQESAPGGAHPRPKIFACFAACPPADRAVVMLNLAVSLQEQTRRRVLVLDIPDHPADRLGPVMGLGIEDAAPRPEDLRAPETLARLVKRHASGLEIMTLPAESADDALFSHLYPLLTALRRGWDYVFVSLGAGLGRAARVFADEADRVLVTWADPPSDGALALFRELETIVPTRQLDRVELTGESIHRRNRPGHFAIPWRWGMGRSCLSRGNPFLPRDAAATQRALDRTARYLGGLRIGLAMGSGAALGYALIGVLRAMERHGVYPDLIAGTSMGALIGAFYASGKDTQELEEIALGITKVKLWSMVDFAFPPWQGVILGREVLKFLKSILGDTAFDELRVPFACVATDINTGEERVLRHGTVAEAVRASISLPFFFRPHLHQGRFMVDGGLVNPVPVSTIKAMGADVRIGVNITTKPAVKRFPGLRPWVFDPFKGPSIFRVMAKTLYTMQYGIAKYKGNDAHVVLAPDLSGFTWAEFHRASEIIKIGEENTEKMMPKILAHLPLYADHCRVPLRPPLVLKPY